MTKFHLESATKECLVLAENVAEKIILDLFFLIWWYNRQIMRQRAPGQRFTQRPSPRQGRCADMQPATQQSVQFMPTAY